MTREVFMPLMCGEIYVNSDQADKLMDVMHRIISQIAVTQSQIEVIQIVSQLIEGIRVCSNTFTFKGLCVIAITSA